MSEVPDMTVAGCLARATASVDDHTFRARLHGALAEDIRGRPVHPADASAARITIEGYVTREAWFAGPAVRREAIGLLTVALEGKPDPSCAAEAETILLNATALAEEERDYSHSDPPGMV